MEHYDIFISYRRDGGEMLAHILYETLTNKGYSVFQDVESLRSGKFNEALYEVIENCNDVILILPPHGLDRCVNDDDWVKNEIVCAMKGNKTIIPVMMRGFEWPEILPDEMTDLPKYNYIEANMSYFDQFMEKICTFLTSGKKEVKRKNKVTIRSVLVFLVYVMGLVYPLFFHFILFDFVFRLIYFLWILAGAIWFWDRIETRPDIAASCFSTISEEDIHKNIDVLYSQTVGVFGKKHFISCDSDPLFQKYYKFDRMEFGSFNGKKTNYLKIIFRSTFEWYDPSVLYLHTWSVGPQASKMLIRQGFVLQEYKDYIPKELEYLKKGDLHVLLSHKKLRINYVEIFNCSQNQFEEMMKNEKIEPKG